MASPAVGSSAGHRCGGVRTHPVGVVEAAVDHREQRATPNVEERVFEADGPCAPFIVVDRRLGTWAVAQLEQGGRAPLQSC